MAFVYETIPEKDWDLFDSWKLRNTSRELMVLRRGSTTEDYRYYEEKEWFVDRERGIYYIFLGIEDMENWCFALIWKGEKILIRYTESQDYAVKGDRNTLIRHFRVFSVVATKGLQDKATVD